MKQNFSKRGQVTLSDAPGVVLLVGLVFLIMATVAYIAYQYGTALPANSVAANVTTALSTAISNNTSIAGIVLTIALVAIVLGVLVGAFALFGNRRA